ncbi:DUF262 domain-containing protein [Streptomyces sp. NBC_01174]|uniref:DUF262 domain-containing protein n=1 Tax=Streptomyces sp. NBC_01174 TaxID=2903758 RepID=UPI00387021BB|nr:DUF262 domain-containing HNH endonuclease family protein [Streptomyces sp. NBC_01174]
MAIIKQAQRQTLGQLIGANNPIVTVPDDSQRQYAWTRKEVDVFWADIQKFKKARESGKESASEYFIGPVVTITEKAVKSRALLDGQQRLTTSTILLAVLRDMLHRMQSPEATALALNIHRDYIARKTGRRTPTEYFLELSLFDRSFFRSNIQDWDEAKGECLAPEKDKRPSHRLILDAYAAFDAKVAVELAPYPDEEERLDWLDGMRECLINGLVFVEIQTPSASDANEVFETINSRGKDLSTVDLVRNFLMEKSTGQHEKERVNDAWRVLLDDFDRREDIEKFLRHYWVAKYGDVKSYGLYTVIRKNLSKEFDKRPQKYGVGAFSADLESASIRYADLITSSTGYDEIDASLREVKALGADALYPLLLAASERAGYDKLHGLIDAMLSYYVRWTVVANKESTHLEENLFEVAKEISGGAGVETATRRICGWIPDDETFKSDFDRASISKTSQARYLLGKIEEYMRYEAGIEEDVALSGDGKLYVENVYPQKPAKELRLEEHDSWVGRIGNLTLLGGRKNPTTANLAYPEKASLYAASSLLITSDTEVDRIWDPAKASWRVEGIVARQQELAVTALKVWPSGERWSQGRMGVHQ